MYIFHRDPETLIWHQDQKIYSQFPVANELFGFSVAINQFFVFIGIPYKSISAARAGTVRARAIGAIPASVFACAVGFVLLVNYVGKVTFYLHANVHMRALKGLARRVPDGATLVAAPVLVAPTLLKPCVHKHTGSAAHIYSILLAGVVLHRASNVNPLWKEHRSRVCYCAPPPAALH